MFYRGASFLVRFITLLAIIMVLPSSVLSVAAVGADNPPACSFVFTKTLKMGMTDAEVRNLQKVLNRDPSTAVALSGPGSSGNESTFFGSRTKVAVMKFQEKYRLEILTPSGLTRGTGTVGPTTRSFLRMICPTHGPTQDTFSNRIDPVQPTQKDTTDTPFGLTLPENCDYIPWKSSVIYPVQPAEKESAAWAYIRNRLGESYTERCVTREPAYDDFRFGRLGFLDKRLTILREPRQQFPVTFYVDLDSANNVTTKLMEATGLLPECGTKPTLCRANVSIENARKIALKNNFPTSTPSILTSNSTGEWRWVWVFWSDPIERKKLMVDMITGKETIRQY